MSEMDDAAFENGLIEEMRANDGRVTSGPLAGHPLLILHTIGARSGEQRRSILTWSSDGEDYIVAGTASGSPRAPGWVHNVAADPEVIVEVGNRTYRATASIDQAHRERLWHQHVAALPWFAPYPEQTGRAIPMVRITLGEAAD